MGKKRFFDDRLKYLSFIQNTGEKKAISEKIYPYIRNLTQNKSYLRILDAGTGDGTIKSNIIKSFHRYHPYIISMDDIHRWYPWIIVWILQLSFFDFSNFDLEDHSPKDLNSKQVF